MNRPKSNKSNPNTESKPTCIDLFCGCGGFSLGLERAGFQILAALDNDPVAIETYRSNRPSIPPEHVLEMAA